MAPSTDSFAERVSRIAALGEPIRRALYRYVAAQPEPVDRVQAADAVGVAHHAAKFHLDKLEAEGLLDVDYSRPPGRGGPGAGRPAKRYRRSATEVAVSLPERRYDLAGHIMAEAITSAATSGVSIARALREAATAAGRRLGEQAREQLGRRASRAQTLQAVSGVLSEYGYEPRQDGDELVLANCPFHELAREHPDLICGVNHDLLESALSHCGRDGLHAHLDPAPGRCCVRIGEDVGEADPGLSAPRR
jgi:predicted ArsR family transcriptional regulator